MTDKFASLLSVLPVLSEAQVDVHAIQPLVSQQLVDAMLEHPVVKTVVSAGIIPFGNDGSLASYGKVSVPAIELQTAENITTVPAYDIVIGSGNNQGPASVRFLTSDSLLGFALQVSVFNTDFPSSRVKIQYFNNDEERIYMAEFDTSMIKNNANIALPYLRQVERMEISGGASAGKDPAAPSFSLLSDEVMITAGSAAAMTMVLTAENAVVRIKPVAITAALLAEVVKSPDPALISNLVGTINKSF